MSQASSEMYPASNVMLSSTVIRLELSSNLLVLQAFACRVLVCFISCINCFSWNERTNARSEISPEKFHKIIQKSLVIEYFLGKLKDLLPEAI